MALIDADYVTKNFPNWELFCFQEGTVAEDNLQLAIDRAIEEFSEYLTRTDTDITAMEKRHILVIAKYNCFEFKHGDTDFSTKPIIVKDYERTIETLQKYAEGKMGQPASTDITMDGKTRKFGVDKWFTDSINDLSDSN